jgi:hypothetical protein
VQRRQRRTLNTGTDNGRAAGPACMKATTRDIAANLDASAVHHRPWSPPILRNTNYVSMTRSSIRSGEHES